MKIPQIKLRVGTKETVIVAISLALFRTIWSIIESSLGIKGLFLIFFKSSIQNLIFLLGLLIICRIYIMKTAR